MNNTKSASEIIRTQCCGNLLDDPKCYIVDQVRKIEEDNESLKLLSVVLIGAIGFLLVVINQ